MSESKCLFFFRSASFGAGSVLALSVIAIVFSTLTVPSSARLRQQKGDGKPRVHFEAGPSSELFSEADLQGHINSFGESFPSFCPGAVVTRERSKAKFIVRLSLAGDVESQAVSYSLAIFQRDGDQVFADTATYSLDTPTSKDSQNPEILLTREACAVIVYQMDHDTIFLVTQQAKRRLLRVGFQVTYHVDPERLSKIPDQAKREKTKQVKEEGLANVLKVALEYGFSQQCFCTTKTSGQPDAGGPIDFNFEVDARKKWLSLIGYDRGGEHIFSANQVYEAQARDSLRDACRAMLLRESAHAQNW